jgi:response regulator NasT
MSANQQQVTRVLVVNECGDRVDAIVSGVAALGHAPVVGEARPGEVADLIAREHPEVILTGLAGDLAQALALLSELVAQAPCPVIALLASDDRAVIRDVARRGVFACVAHHDAADLEGAIDVALERFARYHQLQEAFDRRAAIEQAKGILMAHHGVSAEAAFAMLRMHSQNTGRKLTDIAAALVKSHGLLEPTPSPVQPPAP